MCITAWMAYGTGNKVLYSMCKLHCVWVCLSVRCLRRRFKVKISFISLSFLSFMILIEKRWLSCTFDTAKRAENLIGLVLPAFRIWRGKTGQGSCDILYITVVYLSVSWERGHIAETVGHEYDEDTARPVQRQPNKHARYCPESTQMLYSPISAFSALFLFSERERFKGLLLKFL